MTDETDKLQDDDRRLAAAVRRSMPAVSASASFDTLFAGAERRHRASRRSTRWLGSVAAAVATIAVVFVFSTRTMDVNEQEFIQMAELLESTSWTAPSDALLPDHQFDIYQDLPTLMESTKPAQGALL